MISIDQRATMSPVSPSFAVDHIRDVDESSVVLNSLESPALWSLFWLLLFLNFRCLRLNLSCTSKGAVLLSTVNITALSHLRR